MPKNWNWKEEGRIRYLGKTYQPSFMDGAFLVMAATDDPELNRRVSKDAETRGILMNAVDQPEDCNFIVPSLFRRGGLTIAISTSGRSPALAKKIRKELESTYGEEYESYLALLGKIRSIVLQRGRPAEENKLIFQKIMESSLLDSLKEGNLNRAASTVGAVLGVHMSADDIRSYIDGE